MEIGGEWRGGVEEWRLGGVESGDWKEWRSGEGNYDPGEGVEREQVESGDLGEGEKGREVREEGTRRALIAHPTLYR